MKIRMTAFFCTGKIRMTASFGTGKITMTAFSGTGKITMTAFFLYRKNKDDLTLLSKDAVTLKEGFEN